MIFRVSVAAVGVSLALLLSCDDVRRGQGRGPIVLGDPSTIVTETDSQYLVDMVPDPAFDEAAPSAVPGPDTVAAAPKPVRDTASKQPATPAAPELPSGLTADFGDVQVVLPGIAARNASRSVRGARSAAFTLDGSSFGGKTIVVQGGTAKRVQQRTGYSAMVTINGKKYLLNDLGTQYSGWQTLKGSNGHYTLATQSAPSFNASSTAIRNAVQKAARARRLDRKAEQKLMASVRNVRSVTQAPLSVAPRAYTWKIEGTDAKGKAYTKEVRIDIPL